MSELLNAIKLSDHETYDIELRFLEDGTELINLWRHEDLTGGVGVTITEAEYLKEWGSPYSLEVARAEHARWIEKYGITTCTPAPIPTQEPPILFDFDANYEIIRYATEREPEVTAIVLKALKDSGIDSTQLLTKKGSRLKDAWKLFDFGNWQLAPSPALPLIVQSSKGTTLYHVWRITGGSEGLQCDCDDHTRAQEKTGGYCKHILLQMIIEATATVYKTTRPRPAQTTDPNKVAAA